MCRKTLTLILINTCNKGVSLGLNYYSPQFASNDPYWSAFLNTVVELPPYLFAKFSFQTLGRRTSLFLGLFVAGASCLSAYAVPSHLAWLILTLSLVGKFCITFTYLSGKLFEDETFPTVVRSEGHSMVSVVSSAATCGVPFIVDLGHDSRTLPLVIFGSLCCFASFSTFCLPETLHQRLPQTIQDGEEFGKYMTWKERFRMIPRKKIVANGFAVKELDRLNPSTTWLISFGCTVCDNCAFSTWFSTRPTCVMVIVVCSKLIFFRLRVYWHAELLVIYMDLPQGELSFGFCCDTGGFLVLSFTVVNRIIQTSASETVTENLRSCCDNFLKDSLLKVWDNILYYCTHSTYGLGMLNMGFENSRCLVKLLSRLLVALRFGLFPYDAQNDAKRYPPTQKRIRPHNGSTGTL